MSVTIPLESGRTYEFRPCDCGSPRKPRLDRDFRIGYTVHCPGCGLVTLPEIRERDAVSAWDVGAVRDARRKG